MEGNLGSITSLSASGSLRRLQTRLTSLTTWLGPAWAAWCGAIASGDFDWRGETWLKLGLLIVLVNVGWSLLWAALGSTDWATPVNCWREWRHGDPIAPLPYTLPGSPGDRLSHWLGQLRTWWRSVCWPSWGLAFSIGIVALAVTAVIGPLLGTDSLLLSVAALALMQLGLAWEGGRGTVPPKLDGLIAIALPWLAGHITFSGLLPPFSWGVSLAYALAWGAAWRADSKWERALGLGGQFLVALLLVGRHSSLAAGALMLLLIPQLVLIPWIRRGQPTSWYVRFTRPWLMMAMLVAAWTL